MNVVQGDLITMGLDGVFDVIVHGCNCHNTMKSGIARDMSIRIPEAVIADNRTMAGDRSKLGSFSRTRVYLDTSKINTLDVVNLYTQYDYGTDKVNVDYDAVRRGFKLVKQHYSGKRIGFPKLGAGLARGDWTIISKIIDEELDGEDFTLVEFVRG